MQLLVVAALPRRTIDEPPALYAADLVCIWLVDGVNLSRCTCRVGRDVCNIHMPGDECESQCTVLPGSER